MKARDSEYGENTYCVWFMDSHWKEIKSASIPLSNLLCSTKQQNLNQLWAVLKCSKWIEASSTVQFNSSLCEKNPHVVYVGLKKTWDCSIYQSYNTAQSDRMHWWDLTSLKANLVIWLEIKQIQLNACWRRLVGSLSNFIMLHLKDARTKISLNVGQQNGEYHFSPLSMHLAKGGNDLHLYTVRILLSQSVPLTWHPIFTYSWQRMLETSMQTERRNWLISIIQFHISSKSLDINYSTVWQ